MKNKQKTRKEMEKLLGGSQNCPKCGEPNRSGKKLPQECVKCGK
jgi:transposase